ncbi:transglutaminase domain-containing protein [Bizionia sp.]|uniref:transglutaminase domain-containing protein n=1 Tax=Bizionia sp. TaxID=1954480 RepID=UPI003A8DFCD5
MNLPFNLHLKYLILSLFILISSIVVNAQKNNEIWEALLSNNRTHALELTNSLKNTDDIENQILTSLVKMENGNMQGNTSFVQNISKFPEFEYYLFSNWTAPFFFSDYLDSGFNSISLKIPHVIDDNNISNNTIKNALYYIQAVTKRQEREWDDYFKFMDKVNAITEWEFCGVFENLNSSGIQEIYLPESNPMENTVFDAQSNGKASWYKPRNDKEVYSFFTNHAEFGSGVHYAQTFVDSPNEQRIKLRLGKSGFVRVFLNDVIIIDSENDYVTELDAYSYEVNLQAGINRILVKSATGGEVPFFILRLEDLDGKPLQEQKVSFKARDYKISSFESINPKRLTHDVEAYFKAKLDDRNSDSNLSKFCLVRTYYRNGKLKDAINILNTWSKEYPNSSFINSCLLECYRKIGDNSTANKIESNIKRTDPDYYLSLFLEFENSEDLFKLDLQEFKDKLKRIEKGVDYPFMKPTIDFLISIRGNDRNDMRLKLDKLLTDTSLPANIKTTFAQFYDSLFNDDYAVIESLSEINNNEYNWEALTYLAHYYNKLNMAEKAVDIYVSELEHTDYDNNILYKLVIQLHSNGEFNKSLPFIDKALKNFPNSYLFTKFKADALIQIDRKAEAIKLYKLALERRPSDYELRGKINDLENKTNPLNSFKFENPYQYIDAKRNLKLKNNYGVNILLKQTNLYGYENGGGEYDSNFIYEITSQNGIEIFKEHSLGISGSYLIKKAEIVKPNGELIPAERNGDNLVFDTLEIGDVIYISYYVTFSRNGRFYSDYILENTFQGYHPTIQNEYRFITTDKEVNYLVSNGSLNYNISKKDDFFVHEWTSNNLDGILLTEDYMPSISDVTTKLHISSIATWNEIAVWYSDLVRAELKYDQEVESVFNEIFPEGFSDLSETERAKRIYYYITNNLNYSHVSFKQNGFIPQKPSKTISAKLGDCKDFSSLFLVLAKQAELQANLVLILTAEYGRNSLLLPTTDFNHCIVKVKLEEQDQYLELTSKYLPFKALPTSLRGATALEIPFDSSSKNIIKSELFHLDNINRKLAAFNSSSILEVDNKKSQIELISHASGNLATFYIDVFETQKDEKLLETIESEIYERASAPINLLNIDSFNHDKEKGEIDFKTQLKVDLKVNKVGDVFAFQIPYFTNPYTQSIIKKDVRSFPIAYNYYENSDSYSEKIHIKLKREFNVLNVPKNVNFRFKKHEFSIKYLKINQNELMVDIHAKVDDENISVEDYPEFKEFVEKVLNTRETFIQFN